MTTPYTPQNSPSSYNQSPPADDGTVSVSNQVFWATIKTKLGDPLKTFVESVNTALISAFSKVINTDDLTLITDFDTANDQVLIWDNSANGYRVINPDSLLDAVDRVVPILHVREEQTANTSGGTFTAGSYVKRVLNTVSTNTITGASVMDSVITLPAGDYEVYATAPGYRCGAHKAKLVNTSDTADVIIGTTETVVQAYEVQTRSIVIGKFTLAAEKTLELQHRCGTTQSTNGLGNPGNLGEVEVYSEIIIRKVF